jgi:hypothetical protein
METRKPQGMPLAGNKRLYAAYAAFPCRQANSIPESIKTKLLFCIAAFKMPASN